MHGRDWKASLKAIAIGALTGTVIGLVAFRFLTSRPDLVPLEWAGFVLGTPSKAPKVKALAKNPKVALTIDDNNFPHKVLLVRGAVHLQTVNGIVPEYAVAAERYFGAEQGKVWVTQLASMIQDMVRITITPEWVGLLSVALPECPAAVSHRRQPAADHRNNAVSSPGEPRYCRQQALTVLTAGHFTLWRITPILNRRYDGKVLRSWKLWLAVRRARREIDYSTHLFRECER